MKYLLIILIRWKLPIEKLDSVLSPNQAQRKCWLFYFQMETNVRGIKVRLQEIVENINESLEELKYHLAEIQERLDEEETVPDK